MRTCAYCIDRNHGIWLKANLWLKANCVRKNICLNAHVYPRRAARVAWNDTHHVLGLFIIIYLFVFIYVLFIIIYLFSYY